MPATSFRKFQQDMHTKRLFRSNVSFMGFFTRDGFTPEIDLATPKRKVMTVGRNERVDWRTSLWEGRIKNQFYLQADPNLL